MFRQKTERADPRILSRNKNSLDVSSGGTLSVLGNSSSDEFQYVQNDGEKDNALTTNEDTKNALPRSEHEIKVFLCYKCIFFAQKASFTCYKSRCLCYKNQLSLLQKCIFSAMNLSVTEQIQGEVSPLDSVTEQIQGEVSPLDSVTDQIQKEVPPVDSDLSLIDCQLNDEETKKSFGLSPLFLLWLPSPEQETKKKDKRFSSYYKNVLDVPSEGALSVLGNSSLDEFQYMPNDVETDNARTHCEILSTLSEEIGSLADHPRPSNLSLVDIRRIIDDLLNQREISPVERSRSTG